MIYFEFILGSSMRPWSKCFDCLLVFAYKELGFPVPFTEKTIISSIVPLIFSGTSFHSLWWFLCTWSCSSRHRRSSLGRSLCYSAQHPDLSLRLRKTALSSPRLPTAAPWPGSSLQARRAWEVVGITSFVFVYQGFLPFLAWCSVSKVIARIHIFIFGSFKQEGKFGPWLEVEVPSTLI